MKFINRYIIIAVIAALLTSTVFFGANEAKAGTMYKDFLGLNVHWALGGFGVDQKFQDRLDESNTVWVREHFYSEVFLMENNGGWLKRYDNIMNRYDKLNIKVVGMLAYGKEHGDFKQPRQEDWERAVNMITKRYADKVDVWEVWNEPDSPDYLEPNSPGAYIPILKQAAPIIRRNDPSATILAGALAGPNVAFAEAICKGAPNSFDGMSFHLYGVDEYRRTGNNNHSLHYVNELYEVVKKYKPRSKLWVTELGASTGGYRVSDTLMKDYLAYITTELKNTGKIGRVLLYTIRNRDIGDKYENQFGLLDINLNPRPAWDWYKSVQRGPYNKSKIIPTTESKKASDLKKYLENYFGKGLIPISEKNWPVVADAYIYGNYTPKEIAQSIRFGGKTVHPDIARIYWKNTSDYKNYINKDWSGGLITYAYGKPRLKVTDEASKALELKNHLQRANVNNINLSSWSHLVKAYVYGGYPLEVIIKAPSVGYKTVHDTIPYSKWKETADYKQHIQ